MLMTATPSPADRLVLTLIVPPLGLMFILFAQPMSMTTIPIPADRFVLMFIVPPWL